MKRKIVYIDMDGTLVDFQSGIAKCTAEVLKKYKGEEDTIPGIFTLMDPMPGAIEAYRQIAQHYDTYILSTVPWRNETGANDKIAWLKKHFGDGKESPVYKRIIFSHHKDLNRGDYLIDDRTDKNGVDKFVGEVIPFGNERFPDWEAVVEYLIQKI